MMLKSKIAVIYGAGGGRGTAVLSHAPSRARGPSFFSPGVTGHRSKGSPRRSLPAEDPPRRRRLTLWTSGPWTNIYSP